jgi:hypothetical protein
VTATAILPRFDRLIHLSVTDPAAFQREVKYGDDDDLLKVIHHIDALRRYTDPTEVARGFKLFFARRDVFQELRSREEKRKNRQWYKDKAVMTVKAAGVIGTILGAWPVILMIWQAVMP